MFYYKNTGDEEFIGEVKLKKLGKYELQENQENPISLNIKPEGDFFILLDLVSNGKKGNPKWKHYMAEWKYIILRSILSKKLIFKERKYI